MNTNNDNFQGIAVVDETIRPHQNGRVRFDGTYWFARCNQNVTLTPGQNCNILARQKLTLIIEPIQ